MIPQWLNPTDALPLALSFGLLWLESLRQRDASILDIAWGPGFVLLASWHFLRAEPTPRASILLVLIWVWGLRLAWHIGSRHRGEDARYRRWREQAGTSWWWRSLFTVFLLQALILWVVARPLPAIIQSGTGLVPWLDGAGALLALAGLAWESAGDAQLARFRRDGGRGLYTGGLWRLSRHPNYFGEAVFWWGIYLLALAAGGGASIFSPLIMTLLLRFGSGVPLLERTMSQREGWPEYARRTNAFFPWRPRP